MIRRLAHPGCVNALIACSKPGRVFIRFKTREFVLAPCQRRICIVLTTLAKRYPVTNMASNHPQQTLPPMPHPESNGATIATYLKELQTIAAKSHVYVHPEVISFKNGKAKANDSKEFQASDNLEGRCVFNDFLKAPKQDCHMVWLRLFSMIEANWVKGEDWCNIPMHCWAVALIRQPKGTSGRALLIYDVDPRRPAKDDVTEERALDRTRSHITVQQQAFLTLCRESGNNVRDEVWHPTDTTDSGKNLCLSKSIGWIEWIVGFGDKPFTGEEDPRRKGLDKCDKRYLWTADCATMQCCGLRDNVFTSVAQYWIFCVFCNSYSCLAHSSADV